MLQESIIKLKDGISEIREILKGMEQDPEVIQLMQESESIDPNDKDKTKELEDKYNNIFLKKCESIFNNFTQDEAKLLMSNINEEFIYVNKIPTLSFGIGPFELLMKNFISKCDETFLINLVKKEEFVESISYQTENISNILTQINDDKIVVSFLNNYLNGTYRKKGNIADPFIGIQHDKDILGELCVKLVRSNEVSNELKQYIFNNSEILSVISNYQLSNMIALKETPKHIKLNLLTNEELISSFDKKSLSSILGSLCDSVEECNEYLFNSKFSNNIAYDFFFRNTNISQDDIAILLTDSRIVQNIEEYEIFNIMENLRINAENKYNLLNIYNDKLPFYSIGEIINKSTDKDFRNMCLSDDKIFLKLMENNTDNWLFFEHYFTDAFGLRKQGERIEEKIKLLNDPRFQFNSYSRILQCALRDQDLPMDLRKNILFSDNFYYKIFNEYHEQYNPSGIKETLNINRKEILRNIIENNPLFLNDICVDFFSNDIITNFDFDFIEKVSKYKDIAWEFTSMNDTNKTCFSNMFNCIKNSEYSDNIDIDLFTNRLVKVINKTFTNDSYLKPGNVFSKLMYNEKNIDFQNLNNEQWKVLTEIALRENSLYYVDIQYHGRKEIDLSLNIIPEINSVDDINNYRANRIKMCDETFIEAISSKDLDKAKNAYFNKYFNINIEEAREIVRLYGFSIDQFNNEMNVNYINAIKSVLGVTKLETLQQSYNDKLEPISFDETLFIDQSLRQMFGKNMSDSMFKVVDEQGKQLVEPMSYATYQYEKDGKILTKQIPIYSTGLDFKMLVHSTAAYGEMQLINDNYFDSWNKSDRKKNHGICCSLISNDNLGMAAINDVLFGFDSFDPKALRKSAPYDIYTQNDGYDIEENRPVRYMSVQDIINNTRHTHNESTLEREELRKNKVTVECPNIQPSYVIICSDMKEEIKQKALKCATEMNLPIVYLDKTKIVENEVNKIDKLIAECNNSNDINKVISNIRQIILSHENNRSGLKASNPEWVEQYFPTSKVDTVIQSMITKLQQKLSVDNNYVEYYNACSQLMNIFDEEVAKFDATMESVERTNFIDLPIEKYEQAIMKHINNNLCMNNVPKLDTIISSIKSENNDLPFNQMISGLDSEKISAEIQELIQSGLYKENAQNHNIGHIERVIVLSSIIGNNELKNEQGVLNQENLNMLIECAKYHDCGREKDGFDKKHGSRSAEKMEELLKGKYSENDINMMKAIVEYHEIADDEYIFDKICSKYNVPSEQLEIVKQLSNCLKDADALDRVRFKNPKSKLDENMLRTASSKELVSFSKELVSSYEQIDKEMFKVIVQQMAQQQSIQMENEVVEEISKSGGKGL